VSIFFFPGKQSATVFHLQISPHASSPLLSFIANNRLKGNLPMAVSSMELLSKVNLEGNLSDFAGNVNHVLCSGALNKKNGLEVLLGKKDCSSCLCCTECPGSPSNGDY
jgi:hypothetical protein